MDAPADTSEEQPEEPQQSVRPVGPRRWALRAFVLALLLAGAGTIATAAVTIVRDSGASRAGRPREFGVLMPDATRYREVVGGLQAAKRPRELVGLTVTGASGAVTVLHAKRKGATSFPSTYLNAGALSLIARSIGVHSDMNITVQELRLEKLRATGRLRWRLRGEQAGRPWRAAIAPNGTQLRLLSTRAN